MRDIQMVLFWAHEPQRLSSATRQNHELGHSQPGLAIADISLWQLALPHERGRLQLPTEAVPAIDVTCRRRCACRCCRSRR